MGDAMSLPTVGCILLCIPKNAIVELLGMVLQDTAVKNTAPAHLWSTGDWNELRMPDIDDYTGTLLQCTHCTLESTIGGTYTNSLESYIFLVGLD